MPSQNSSSALIMLVKLPERNSNSAFLAARSRLPSRSFSSRRLGHMEMKLFSSRNSAENDIRGLEIGSTRHFDVAWMVSRETICDEREEMVFFFVFRGCVHGVYKEEMVF